MQRTRHGCRGKNILSDARRWYFRSLAISEEIDDSTELVRLFGRLGIIVYRCGESSEAMESTVRSVRLAIELAHPLVESGLLFLTLLTAELGFDELASCWQRVTGQVVPPAVVAHVRARLANQPEE